MKTGHYVRVGMFAGLLFATVAVRAQSALIRYAISFDGGITYDPLTYAYGGFPRLSVVSNDGDGSVTKALTGGTEPGPLTLLANPGSTGLLSWASEVFKQDFGQVQATKRQIRITATVRTPSAEDCADAGITDVGFPALDAGAHAEAHITVHCDVGASQFTSATLPFSRPAPNAFSSNRFIWSLPQAPPGSQVDRIEKIVVKQKNIASSVGQLRSIQDVSDITILVPATQAGPYYQWLADTVKATSAGLNLEEQGSLTYCDSFGNPVCTLQLNGLGIRSVSPADLDADANPDVAVTMYVQSVQLSLK